MYNPWDNHIPYISCPDEAITSKIKDSAKAVDKLAQYEGNQACSDLKVCIANELEDLNELVHKVAKAQAYKKVVAWSWNLFYVMYNECIQNV